MMSASNSNVAVTMKPETRELILERIFTAQQESVFKVYSESPHLECWWGPKGWRTSTLQMDFRPGGVWHFCMTSPDGKMTSCAKFAYQEIVFPKMISYIESFVDEAGNKVGDLPDRKVTVTFEGDGDRTKLVMITEFGSVESLQAIIDMGMVQGFTENFNRLDNYLPNFSLMEVMDEGYQMTRLFDAPCEVVYRAWSSPEHLSHWWGPNGFSTTTEEFDMRPGGEWKFIMHGPDGTDYRNHIVFIEVEEGKKIVFRHKAPDFLATATFEDVSGGTRLTYSTRFAAVSEFDRMKSYAVPGGQQTIERLGTYLQTAITSL